jgi:methyl-accepting chemotaxis protein
MTFEKYSVRARLYFGFALILAILATVTLYGTTQVHSIDNALRANNDRHVAVQRHAINFRGSAHDRSIAIRDVVLASSPADRRKEVETIDRLAKFYADSAGPLETMIGAPDAGPELPRLYAGIKEIETRTVADGGLGPVPGAASAPSGSVLASLGSMQQSLARIVGMVRSASDSIGSASEQIAHGNNDLSQRTESQAANLQETSSSMQQLSRTVDDNAATANQANQMAGTASAAAERGGEVVGQVVATMEDIATSSRKISDIIGVIDGIAFQTNILALNAAVEAARAGEQGRGFAVVASEVRGLAQRSADAAREIKTLISASVDKVENGSRLVGDAGRTMDDIVGQVRNVTDLIGQISGATSEQTRGIAEVGRAIHQLDDTTQQNAALVEQSAAASENLRLQAHQLAETVKVFKLDGSTHG